MKIGLALPTLLASIHFKNRIFAPKDLYVELVNGLAKKGHEVYSYAPFGIKTEAKNIDVSTIFEEKVLSSVKLRNHPDDEILYRVNAAEYEAAFGLAAYTHAIQNDIEIMHLYIDSLAHYAADLAPFPTVMTMHDPPFAKDTIEGWRFGHFAKHPHIAISHRQAELYGKEFNIAEVIHHGVNLETFPFSDIANGYLAFVGRLVPEKGVEDAIDTSAAVNYPLHIATSGNYTDSDFYKTHLQSKIENSLVTMTGQLNKEERDNWMKNAKALLMPIKWEEPFGMVMVEAMACGTPVIAYALGSVPEIVRDGVTGFVVAPTPSDLGHLGDLKIKKTGIEGLIEAVRRIGEIDRAACRKHVEDHFTVEKMVAEHERVYKRILSHI